MKNAVIEKPEFPGASIVEPVSRLTRHGMRAAWTEKPSGLRHANATIFPYEDEDASFEQYGYYFGKTNGNRTGQLSLDQAGALALRVFAKAEKEIQAEREAEARFLTSLWQDEEL